MSNSDDNNSHLTTIVINSPSSSTANLTITSPTTIDEICSAPTSSISTTPRRIVKAKRSLVWKYFSNSKDDIFNAECLLCSSVILRKSTSTSNLLHHIQAQHNTEYQHFNKAMKTQTRTSDSSRLPLTSDRSVHLTKLIADLIIYNFLPLSIVESPNLQAILQEAEPSYVVPKRKYFTNNVFQEMYDEVRSRVYEELQQAPGNSFHVQNEIKIPFFNAVGVCLTTDIWTSQANQAYMTVTAHFIDMKNNKLKNFVLETKEFTGNHTAERIVERLENICNEWSISDRSVCLVSDTCNTMSKVGKDFRKGMILFVL
jgi:hypothetical protein